MNTGGYEFSAGENAVMSGTSRAMQAAAAGFLALGVLQLAMVGLHVTRAVWMSAALGLVKTVVFVLIALWTRRAASSFQKVVSTRGADIEHVMDAVHELRWAYVLHGGLLLLVIIGVGVLVSLSTPGLLPSPAALQRILIGAM